MFLLVLFKLEMSTISKVYNGGFCDWEVLNSFSYACKGESINDLGGEEKEKLNLLFLLESLLKFVFFLRKAFQNLFFPQEGLLFFPWEWPIKFIFAWEAILKIAFLEKRLQIFFSRFPPAPSNLISLISTLPDFHSMDWFQTWRWTAMRSCLQLHFVHVD